MPLTAFDKSGLIFELGLKTSSTWDFATAQALIVVDGRKEGPFTYVWNPYHTEEATLNVPIELSRRLTGADEVILHLLTGKPGMAGQVSFKLTPDQLADCRLMLAKYDSIRSAP